jgi:hypothetical protein
MSKLVLWLRIARKYRPLFSLELQWLDLQILPDGHDPNAGGQRSQQVANIAIAEGLTNPHLGQIVKLNKAWLVKHPSMFGAISGGTWEITKLTYGSNPKALCRLIDDKKKRSFHFALSDLEPFDYGQGVSD